MMVAGDIQVCPWRPGILAPPVFDWRPGRGAIILGKSGGQEANMGTSLEGKVALVTGGRRGIGRAVALALAGAGADVAVADIVKEDGLLDGVAGEIKALGRSSLAIKVDISHAGEVDAMTKSVLGRFGRIDILVNGAGIWIPGQTLVECPEENWDRVIDVNLKGTYLCCRSVGRAMLGQRAGSIVNLSSQVGLNPGTGAGAYSISKAGIIMMTRQLALEMAHAGVRVNALAPGIVRTDFNIDLWRKPEDARRMAGGVPLGRLAEPEDVARAALFLASDEAAYITGAILPVDGGWRAGGVPRRE
jgi:NAD(P)-dependent dehydrogenase (short-subunit alcohol dehydrogenase family)